MFSQLLKTKCEPFVVQNLTFGGDSGGGDCCCCCCWGVPVAANTPLLATAMSRGSIHSTIIVIGLDDGGGGVPGKIMAITSAAVLEILS